jgi:ketosteroid isomerase-like protein
MAKMTTLAAVAGAFCAIVPGAPAAAEDVRKIVADLDTQYQLAVKNRDVATMDRILADDFVLVTGRGKVSNKADLLKEARGNTVYEHQEDTEQTVRVWGDTAVVTALLGEGHRGWQTLRVQALVQRYVRANARGLALRVRPGFAAAAEGAMKTALRRFAAPLLVAVIAALQHSGMSGR